MDCNEYLPITKEDIHLDLMARTKEAVIRSLAAFACERLGDQWLDAAIVSVMKREGSHPTGLAHGVACPHGFVKGLPRLCVAVARLAEAVDFGAGDGIPARHVFLILSPENQDGMPYIRALSSITRYYEDPSVLARLEAAASAEEYFILLHGCHDA